MMPKISSILPSNRRITSTDIANERPLRPGVPSFGQPVAATANTKNEFQKIDVSDDELNGGTYSPEAKMMEPLVQSKVEIETADQANPNYGTLDVRA